VGGGRSGHGNPFPPDQGEHGPRPRQAALPRRGPTRS
jgi:hypothetical protein